MAGPVASDTTGSTPSGGTHPTNPSTAAEVAAAAAAADAASAGTEDAHNTGGSCGLLTAAALTPALRAPTAKATLHTGPSPTPTAPVSIIKTLSTRNVRCQGFSAASPPGASAAAYHPANRMGPSHLLSSADTGVSFGSPAAANACMALNHAALLIARQSSRKAVLLQSRPANTGDVLDTSLSYGLLATGVLSAALTGAAFAGGGAAAAAMNRSVVGGDVGNGGAFNSAIAAARGSAGTGPASGHISVATNSTWLAEELGGAGRVCLMGYDATGRRAESRSVLGLGAAPGAQSLLQRLMQAALSNGGGGGGGGGGSGGDGPGTRRSDSVAPRTYSTVSSVRGAGSGGGFFDLRPTRGTTGAGRDDGGASTVGTGGGVSAWGGLRTLLESGRAFAESGAASVAEDGLGSAHPSGPGGGVRKMTTDGARGSGGASGPGTPHFGGSRWSRATAAAAAGGGGGGQEPVLNGFQSGRNSVDRRRSVEAGAAGMDSAPGNGRGRRSGEAFLLFVGAADAGVVSSADKAGPGPVQGKATGGSSSSLRPRRARGPGTAFKALLGCFGGFSGGH